MSIVTVVKFLSNVSAENWSLGLLVLITILFLWRWLINVRKNNRLEQEINKLRAEVEVMEIAKQLNDKRPES